MDWGAYPLEADDRQALFSDPREPVSAVGAGVYVEPVGLVLCGAASGSRVLEQGR